MSSMREAVKRDMAGARTAHLMPVEATECNYQIMQSLGNGNTNLFSRVEHEEFYKGDFCVLVRTRVRVGTPSRVEEPSLAKVVKASHLCKSGPFKGYWKTVVKPV